MLGMRDFLKVEVMVVASTVIAFALFAVITSYVITNVVTGITYFIFVGVALINLLLSLCIGCHGMIKCLLLIGCDQWNTRMISSGFIFQIVLLCMGLLCYSISLFLIR